MILEGIVTTLNEDGSPNVAPMGPTVDPDITDLTLRPFQSSTTYQNLKRHGEGVFHVTDDVELIAKCTVSSTPRPLELKPAPGVQGVILADACRWYAFRVIELDDQQPRVNIRCQIKQRGRLRDFFGFNRAKHAVIEAAILASRVHLLEREEIEQQFDQLAVIVEKTAGEQERRAFEFLRQHIRRAQEPAAS